MFEIFLDVVFKDSHRRSQNIDLTGSTLVLLRFSPVDRAKFFDISVAPVPMTAEHLHVAAVSPRQLQLFVNGGDLLLKTFAVLLISDDRIV